MQKTVLTRRGFLRGSAVLSAPLLLAVNAPPLAAAAASSNRKLRIVCIGAHPDDPESGCGDTLAQS